jgi:hypothetical protein
MRAPNCGKPATEATVNGLQEVIRLAELIKFQPKSFLRASQADRRKRTFCPGWIVVRWRRSWSRSIPVYIRRSECLWAAVTGGACHRDYEVVQTLSELHVVEVAPRQFHGKPSSA